jgi:hypothetical protein
MTIQATARIASTARTTEALSSLARIGDYSNQNSEDRGSFVRGILLLFIVDISFENSSLHQQPSMFDSVFSIHFQKHDGGAADRSLAVKVGAVPCEMVVPVVDSRIEQRNEVIGLGIKSRSVRSLGIIALGARPTRIACGGWSTVFSRTDVIDFVWK